MYIENCLLPAVCLFLALSLQNQNYHYRPIISMLVVVGVVSPALVVAIEGRAALTLVLIPVVDVWNVVDLTITTRIHQLLDFIMVT